MTYPCWDEKGKWRCHSDMWASKNPSGPMKYY